MATIRLETHLDCPPDHAWTLVQTSGLLRHVTAPLMRFAPIEPPQWPEVWREGRYRVRMYAFGFIPVGSQDIAISVEHEHPDAPDGAYMLRDNGSGDLMQTWDHWIFIAPAEGGGARYVDQVTVKAGVLTPGAALFAWLFYAWRQRRWRGVVRRGLSF